MRDQGLCRNEVSDFIPHPSSLIPSILFILSNEKHR
jgi:hypothetical protein